MDHLDRLENRSIFILREAYAKLKNVCMLWSIGKDSTVMLWLARKAFLGHVPLPLVHIDTRYKIPEMIAYRDRLTREWKLDMVYGENTQVLDAHQTFPDGKIDRINCCRQLKTEPLKHVVNATGPGIVLTTPLTVIPLKKILNPIAVSSPGSVRMRKAQGQKTGIFLCAIDKASGILPISPLNFGIILIQRRPRGRISGSILYWTGLN